MSVNPEREAPRVSVIVPAFNAAKFLRRCLDSALHQTYPLIEILVVDDGSTDDSPSILREYGDRIVVITTTNRGLTSARNRALESATGEFVAFLDADDAWHPDKIRSQIAFVAEHPQCGVVHTKAEFIGVDDQRVDQPIRPWDRHPASGECTVQLLDHCTVIISSALVRRDLLPVPAFTLPHAPGSEDWNLWLRLSLRTAFGYIDEPLTYYRLHADNMSKRMLTMDRSRVAALEQFLDEGGMPAAVDAAARARLRDVLIATGHAEFEHGNFERARKAFLRAGKLRWSDRKRLALTFLRPEMVFSVRKSLHGILGDAAPERRER